MKKQQFALLLKIKTISFFLLSLISCSVQPLGQRLENDSADKRDDVFEVSQDAQTGGYLVMLKNHPASALHISRIVQLENPQEYARCEFYSNEQYAILIFKNEGESHPTISDIRIVKKMGNTINELNWKSQLKRPDAAFYAFLGFERGKPKIRVAYLEARPDIDIKDMQYDAVIQ